ncbi:Leucine-rich repeat-containing protein 34 [Podochytrium sp. JEL0797]|nr:Leucine-rich repeat-containing protein 34 [Podochytrium sp. JEL0797]
MEDDDNLEEGTYDAVPSLLQNDDSIHVIDFIDEYVKQCGLKKIKVMETFKNNMQASVDSGYVPLSMDLCGTTEDLKHSRIEDVGAYVLFRALNHNTFLLLIDLSFNEIGDKGAENIADYIKSETRLKKLILHSNNIGPTGGASIGKAFLVNESIQEFDISSNPIGKPGGMEFAASLQVNTCLQKLLLSQCSLGTDALVALSTVLQSTRTVKTMCLSNNEDSYNRLTQSCANDVVLHLSGMVKANRGIEKLGFAKMGISDFMMIEYLAPAVLVNRRISTLDLSCNKITRDGGVALFQALYKQSFLVHLNLSCCAIQDEGAEAVNVMLLHNRTLQTLFLDHNRIGSRGIRNIAAAIAGRNRTLKCLTLWGNQWDEYACKDFAPLVGGPRNIDKENVGGIGGVRKPPFSPITSRLDPGKVDVCFYTANNTLMVCRNQDMNNKDFSCAVDKVTE